MAWKTRGGRSYYYTGHHIDGKVRYFYHGTGARGRMAERFMEKARAERRSAVASVREYWTVFDQSMGLIRQLDENCHLLIDARLLSEGYWRSNGYRWRKRRLAENRKQLRIRRSAAQPRDLRPLIDHARDGDDKACKNLAAELTTNVALWTGTAELAARSGTAIIDRIAGGNSLQTKALNRQVQQLTRQLAGSSAALEEQVEAEWLVQCWLLCWEADQIYTEAGGGTRKFAVLALKNMIAANHRFKMAVLKLAAARALVPAAALAQGLPKSSPGPQPRADSAGSPTCPPSATLVSTLQFSPTPRRDKQQRLPEESPRLGVLKSDGLDDEPLLNRQVQQAWINLIAAGNSTMEAALQLELPRLTQELGGDSPSPLERLVAERVAIIRFQNFYANVSYAEWESTDVRQGAHLLQRLNVTHRWLLAGLNLLVRLRQMRRELARSASTKGSCQLSTESAKPVVNRAPRGGRPSSKGQAVNGATQSGDNSKVHDHGGGPDCGRPAADGKQIVGIDLAGCNERIWIDKIANRVPGDIQVVRQEIIATKGDLDGPSSSPPERILVDCVAACKLQAYYAEFAHQQACELGKKQATHARRWWQSACRRRHLTITALAAMRTMLESKSKSGSQWHSPCSSRR